MKIVSLDLETCPDFALGRLLGHSGDDRQVAHAMEQQRLEITKGSSSFLPPGFHRIVAVGLAGLDLDTLAVKVYADCGEDEAALIGTAVDALRHRPTLVTYNGNSFDLPVLCYRALKHGTPIPALYQPTVKNYDRYLYRFGDTHIDLADVLSNYGASSRMKLNDVARLCGFEGKTTTGADVLDLWLDGKRDAILKYVGDDATLTLRVALRFLLTQGRLDPAQYDAALNALDTYLAGVPA